MTEHADLRAAAPYVRVAEEFAGRVAAINAMHGTDDPINPIYQPRMDALQRAYDWFVGQNSPWTVASLINERREAMAERDALRAKLECVTAMNLSPNSHLTLQYIAFDAAVKERDALADTLTRREGELYEAYGHVAALRGIVANLMTGQPHEHNYTAALDAIHDTSAAAQAYEQRVRAEAMEEEREAWYALEVEIANHPDHTKEERFGAHMMGASRRAAIGAAAVRAAK
jgi:hypothetical protein